MVAGAFCARGQVASGGIGLRNVPFNVSVPDRAGNLYFTGSAAPGDIVPTAGAVQSQPGGGVCFTTAIPVVFTRACRDAVLEKIDAQGNVVFATYLGGDTDDSGSQIALGAAGNIYVAGSTGGDFPVTPGALAPGASDKGVFLAKFSADGKRIFSTYLPGYFGGAVLAVDSAGSAYLAGGTQTDHGFVIRMKADGSAMAYNTLIAGSIGEAILAIVADGYVTHFEETTGGSTIAVK
ncbi:MAG: cell surface protein [Candidatus Solibacter sp.]|nr:cell surface protein [Candidatus Solibacter sp.]